MSSDSPSSAATGLPPEILAHIFHLLSYHHESWSHPEKWTTVSHVCRSWRAAALHDPTLWAYVSEWLPRPWMDEYLRRSDPLPVQLVYSLMSSREVRDHVSAIVLESTHRLGKLVIDQRDGCDILSRISRPAPMLTELTLLSNGHDRNPQQRVGGHFPSLSKLVLSSVTLPLRASWLRNVRDLELDYSFYDEISTSVALSVNTLLDLLTSLPNLERLLLEARVFGSSDIPVFENYEHKLHLGHLKTAEICFGEACIPLSDIFNHISLAKPVRLILSLEMASVDSVRIQAACKFFLENISQPPSKFVWYDICIAVVSYPSSSSFAGELLFLIEQSHRGELFAVLANLLLPYVAIRNLQVESPLPDWVSFFCDSTTVEKIEFCAIEPLQTFLSTPSTSFPSLRHLHIRNFDISDYMPMLMAWLAGRNSAGMTLENLTLSSIESIEDRDLASLGRYVTVSIESQPQGLEWAGESCNPPATSSVNCG